MLQNNIGGAAKWIGIVVQLKINSIAVFHKKADTTLSRIVVNIPSSYSDSMFAGAQFAELIIQISLGIVIRSGTIESIKDKRIGIIAVQDCNQIVTYGTAGYIDTIIIREFYIKHWVWAHDISISKLIIVDVGLYNRGIIVRAGKGTITAYYKIGIYAHSLPAIIMGVQHHLTAAKVKIDVFGQNDTYLKLAISGSGTTSKQHA